MKLMLENPARDNIGTSRSRNKCPGAIINKSLKLILHSCMQVQVNQSAAIVSRYR
jgi:hypothetical protein